MEVINMYIKKRLLLCLLVISSIMTLTGCLEPVEINKLGIVAGIAIDKEDDKYIVTTQVINPSAIAGESQGALPVYSLKAEGESIHEAYKKLDQITSFTSSLSHLNAIVINEELAKAGISPLLNFALRRFDIRPDIAILVAKDESAGDILNVLTAIDMIPSVKMNISSRVSSRTQRLTSYNLYQVVDMVNTDSINVVLNAISIYHEEEHLDKNIERKDGTEGKTASKGSTIDNILDVAAPVQLRIEHLAVFQGDKITGFIDDHEAQLYNMVMGAPKRYDIVTRIEKDYYTSLGVTQTKSKITTDLANNEATIKMKLTGMIFENTYPIDFTNEENLVAISEHLKSHFEQDISDFVDKVQTELKSDIFGIGGKAHAQESKIWKEKEGYWSELFPELTINIEIELEIDSVGEIGNVTL